MRLALRPVVVGEVLHFTVARAVHEEGAYACGSVLVRPLPEAVHGLHSRISVPLRRLDGAVGAAELKEHVKRESQKAPSLINVAPVWLGSGMPLTVRLAISFATG